MPNFMRMNFNYHGRGALSRPRASGMLQPQGGGGMLSSGAYGPPPGVRVSGPQQTYAPGPVAAPANMNPVMRPADSTSPSAGQIQGSPPPQQTAQYQNSFSGFPGSIAPPVAQRPQQTMPVQMPAPQQQPVQQPSNTTAPSNTMAVPNTGLQQIHAQMEGRVRPSYIPEGWSNTSMGWQPSQDWIDTKGRDWAKQTGNDFNTLKAVTPEAADAMKLKQLGETEQQGVAQGQQFVQRDSAGNILVPNAALAGANYRSGVPLNKSYQQLYGTPMKTTGQDQFGQQSYGSG